MIFIKGQNYKLTETMGALVITAADIKVKDPAAKPLCLADAGALLTYLDRYFFEREAGKSMTDAHDLALRTAHIPLVGKAPD